VLRHRILPTREAAITGITTEAVIAGIVESVEVS
jgi:MoxR-like ATPase